MKIKRASLCQGKGSLTHNMRLFTANNVDKTRTKDNKERKERIKYDNI